MNTRLNVLQESTLSLSLSRLSTASDTALTLVQVHHQVRTLVREKTRSLASASFNDSINLFRSPRYRIYVYVTSRNSRISFSRRSKKKLSTDVTVDEERAFVSLKVASSRDLGDLREHLTRQRCNTPPVASPPLTSVQTPRAPARAAHVGQLTPSGETSGPFAS